MKIKVGIFFGGPSREREQSFASGRMVYDHLDRALFEPVPIWVTSRQDFILLDWSFLYKDRIRHFFPPLEALPASPNAFQVYEESLGDLSNEDWGRHLQQIGRRLAPSDLPQWISLAFLTIPGRFGADGQLQQILAEQQIPFTGSGVAACRSLFSKAAQKACLAGGNIPTPRWRTINREDWLAKGAAEYYQEASGMPGFPLLVRPGHQDIPTGTALLDEEAGIEAFGESVDRAFFRERIPVANWREAGSYDKLDHLRLLTDPKDALGFPIDVTRAGEQVTFHHPEQLLKYLEERAIVENAPEAAFLLESRYGESEVSVEEYIDGLPFSCVVVRPENGNPIALLPSGRPYDMELPGHPLPGEEGRPSWSFSSLPAYQLERIRRQSEAAFEHLGIQAFGRLDGYLKEDGRVFISEACPVPDFRPGALLFRQMAILGLTPTQTITFLLRSSLQERLREWPQVAALPTLCELLDEKIAEIRAGSFQRKKVAVLMGGDTSNRALPLERGRYVFERLAASADYDPLLFFLTGEQPDTPLFQLPVRYLFHESSEALQRALAQEVSARAAAPFREEMEAFIDKYASRDRIREPHQIELHDLSEWVDCVWIAVCGRPASDGALQMKLETLGLPFNGSRQPALRVAHNRYRSLEILGKNGLLVPEQWLLRKADFQADPEAFYEGIESKLGYPLLAMPVDEHHPTATRTLDDRSQLQAYCRLLFRQEGHEGLENRYLLKLRPHDEFPRKEKAHFQAQVRSNGASQFLKIQGGALTHRDSEHNIRYELFTPSEVIVDPTGLTQEEQYLLGEGSCITPARFAVAPEKMQTTKRQVKQTLEKAIRILQLEGIASLEGYVRLWKDGQVETIISDVQAQPSLTPENCLLQQAVHQGYAPVQLLEKQLQYGEERIQEPATAGVADPLDATEPRTVSSDEGPADADSRDTGAAALSFSQSDLKSLILEWLKNTGAKIWDFLKSPFFLKNLAALMGFLLLLFLLLNALLKSYTHHGESLQVHNYVGMKIDEAIDKAHSRSFKIVISDSVFLVDREPNIVLEQTPLPFSRVKENRRIYVTVTSSTAPKVLLPPLEGAYNYNAYRRKLIRLGLNPTIRDRQFNNKLEENTILYFYHDSERITEERLRQGVKVPKGSTLEFVVTERIAQEVAAPDLICMRFEEASWVITNYELVVGEVVGSVSNQANAYVYRQEPAPGQMVQKGSQVNVFLTANRPSNCGGEDFKNPSPQEDSQEEPQEEELIR